MNTPHAMRIVLLYPPPWKISEPGEPPPPAGQGPPAEFVPGDLDPDFHQIPYGLLTLGAQAMRAGHQVKVLNLSAFPWSHVERLVADLEADVWGMSCWTANRRGVAYTADAIRARHPKAHIIVGGPHATPLPLEMLAHHPAIDTIVIGEGEATFLAAVEQLTRGEPVAGVPGTAFRNPSTGKPERAPTRASIRDLDTLASPHDVFVSHIVMTSRGCPWACTFCGAEASWGRGFRAHGTSYILDALEKVLTRLPVRMIQIKDDTFTTQRKRVLELCRAIRARDMRFVWSCDTRVDVLDDELLREMRLAGCERLSLGVESGSATILKNIDKKITPEEILASTEIARTYGIQVRYYMMVGNRGETEQTMEESIAFLERAKPNQYLFSCLSIYPGTHDFDAAVAGGWLTAEDYFHGDFQELKLPFDASESDARAMTEWFSKNKGLKHFYEPTVDEYRAILARLGEHWAAHLDLGAAMFRAGELDGAETHVRRAIELGHPLSGVAYNYLACIAYARGDVATMMDRFTEGVEHDSQHAVLLRNIVAVHEWMQRKGPETGAPLPLESRHDFQLLERTIQPTLPGPLPPDIVRWDAVASPSPPAAIRPIRPEEIVEHDRRRRLHVIAGAT